ncbi:MAG: penicillin-binding protein 2 [Parvularculaceae bacterium]
MARINSHDPERQEVLTRRATLFGGAFTLMLAVVGGRLFQLQVADHQKYLDLANDNQYNRRVLTPLRGEIVDRFGRPLASNRQTFRLLFIPEQTKDLDEAFEAVHAIIPLSEEKRARIRRQMRRRGQGTPIEIDADLTWDEFAKINFDLPHLPGVLPEVGEARNYPLGGATAFVVGYVGAVTDKDIAGVVDEGEENLLRQPGFKVGREGLEKTYDRELRGVPGALDVKVNAYGRVIEELTDKARPPIQGQTLALTIDAELQLAAMKELEGESASAVVMDVVTGDILVLASTPAFDPNDFNFGIKPDLWKQLNESPYHPLLNKPISALYPPGSTFKMISAMAAEMSGVSPSFTVSCPGKLWYGNRYFHCWKKGGHGGGINMRNGIKHSCDVYFYTLAKSLEIDVLAEAAHKLGLGQKFELGIPGQRQGVVPSREWKKAYYAHSPENQTWFPGETLSVIIGQGYVTATPLQLAVMAARIATGKEVRPRIVRVTGDRELPPQPFSDLGIDPKFFATIRAGMDAVVNEPGGTAVRSALENPEWRMAGKTGTSQVYAITAADRARGLAKPEDLPWHRRDHALFVCYAPVENPRYACSVVVEHGIGGARMAGPKAREIMRAVTTRNPAARPAYDPRSAVGAQQARAG